MRIEKTPEELKVIRHKYEYTNKPLEEIGREHRMGARTLNSWARRWNWTPRRVPIPDEGPPPSPPPQIECVAPLLPAAPQGSPPAPAHASAMNDAPDSAPLAPQIDTARLLPFAAADNALPAEVLPGDPDTPTALRLQGAVASVLAAIEAIVAKIGGARLGESDRSARALAALTRTLRELNTLQGQYEEPAADDDSPADIDEFRLALCAKIDAFVAAQGGGAHDDAGPEGA